ncbi:THAP domain-containing protein 1-like, partial [Aphis craccivora]
MPSNLEMLSKWKDTICMFQPGFNPSTNTKSCSKHFKETDYNLSIVSNKKVLKGDAVPSLETPYGPLIGHQSTVL